MKKNGRMRIGMDPLLLAVLIPAALFGYFWAMVAGLIAVVFHEMCHICAARAFGIQTVRVALTPFGGLAAMGSAPTPKAAFCIALAGPLANLMMAQILLLMYRAYASPILQMLIVANLAVGLFNLLPAYPLDGGRMLHVLLTPILGMERARRFCCSLGMLLGGGILVYAVWSAYTLHVINISFFLVGALLLVLSDKQRRTDVYTALKQSQRKRRRMRARPIEARQMAASEQAPAMELLRTLKQGQYMTAYVLDEAMKVRGILDETQILDGIVRFGSTCTLEKILDHQSDARVN